MPPKVTKKFLVPIGALVLAALFGFGIYSYLEVRKENSSLKTALDAARSNLSELKSEKLSLGNQLQTAESTIETFQGQISTITDTVGTLKKLSETDLELLKKYSKVYFLNENYKPASLSDVDTKYLYSKDKPLQFLSGAWPFLRSLLDASLEKGLDLRAISAYRSYSTQGGLKSTYKVTYGAGTANQFSAEQGYSEHQLGTAVDFTTLKTGAAFTGFDKTPEYAWLTANAYNYGFILSYPKNNAYYIYEPWHWRFIGVQLATKLHDENKYFYYLDQREIDDYLVHLFD
ncbi:M15 family metallopeptidase [Candidatus Parcubacteria bacterium]|nr:M15 family metallopeptidase [Candidatus Parcubacteria bacterium]